MAISIFDGVHVWSESNTVEDVSAKTKVCESDFSLNVVFIQ